MTSNKTDKGLMFLTVLLWPLLGLFMAIKNFSRFNTKPILYFMCTLYGYTFVIDEAYDGSRYVNRFKEEYGKPFKESYLYSSLSGLYDTSIDFFEPLITFIISRFTDSQHILFAVYSLIFGYFWVKSIDLVVSKFDVGMNHMSIIYTILFISAIPIFYVNGFRMWTAAWVFLYGALQVILNENRNYLILAFCAIFIHFSFFVANLVLIAWVFLGNRKWIFLGLAVVTLTVKELDLGQVKAFASMLNTAAENKANAYGNEDYAKSVEASLAARAWFLKASDYLTKYLLFANLIIFTIKSDKYEIPKIDANILSFTLLFFSYANVVSLVPSGARFMAVYNVLGAIASIILFSKYYYRRIDSIYGLGSLVMVVLFVLIVFRVASPSINTVILAPGFLIPFGYNVDWSIFNWLF